MNNDKREKLLEWVLEDTITNLATLGEDRDKPLKETVNIDGVIDDLNSLHSMVTMLLRDYQKS